MSFNFDTLLDALVLYVMKILYMHDKFGVLLDKTQGDRVEVTDIMLYLNSLLIPSKDIDLKVSEHQYHLMLDHCLLDNFC